MLKEQGTYVYNSDISNVDGSILEFPRVTTAVTRGKTLRFAFVKAPLYMQLTSIIIISRSGSYLPYHDFPLCKCAQVL
jgi:hypothetical protein